eukprot:7464582-Ditylum_brightwellii.AAC.1
MKEFRKMIQAEQTHNNMILAQTIMGYLDLKPIEKESTTKGHMFKPLEMQWFSAKNSNATKLEKLQDTGGEEDVYIECDSLVKLKCKQGKKESIEYYHVLALFTKYYNKWYIAEESKLKWGKLQKENKACTLA